MSANSPDAYYGRAIDRACPEHCTARAPVEPVPCLGRAMVYSSNVTVENRAENPGRGADNS